MTSRVFLLLVLTSGSVAAGESSPPPAHKPEAASVQRYGAGYRYPQAGWIVLHVEGEPYTRGYQQGRLLAPEIAGHVRALANQSSAKAPADGWKHQRTVVNALFLRRFDREFLDEMKGIADGAAAAGATFESRPIDLVDVAAMNVWMELETLDSALEAKPTGLEGVKYAKPGAKVAVAPPMGHCSAFAATGPATADGKIVFGHVTMTTLPGPNTATSGWRWSRKTADGSSCNRSRAASGRARTTTSTTPEFC